MFMQIVDATKRRLGVTIEEPQQRRRMLKREIFEARKIIRSWDGLVKPSKVLSPLGDFGGSPNIWNDKYIYFYDACEKNMMSYYSSFLTNDKAVLAPVFPLLHGNNAYKTSKEDWKKCLNAKLKALPTPLYRHYKKALEKANSTLEFIELDGIVEEEFRDAEARKFTE